MRTSRTAEIPHDHAFAELAAFPLASEAALRLCPTELDPRMGKTITKNLWRAAESQLIKELPAFMVDELVHLRDLLWFSNETNQPCFTAVSLGSYLRGLARRCLRISGSQAVPDLSGQPLYGSAPEAMPSMEVRSRSFWRWLSFALPPDLLLSGLGTTEYIPQEVNTLSPLLNRMLQDRGFSEVHLHIGAALDFQLIWISSHWVVTDPKIKADFLESPGAGLNEGRDLGHWLIRAMLARYLLASHLATGEKDFMTFMLSRARAKMVNLLGITGYTIMIRALYQLANGRLNESNPIFNALQRIFSILSGIRAFSIPDSLERINNIDPISPIFPCNNSPETQWVGAGLHYMDRIPEDQAFACLFWQVIRVRSLLYRHLVQRPMIPGLQWFVRFYSRIKALRSPLHSKVLIEKAGELCGLDNGLKSLEIRTSSKKSVQKTLGWIEKAASAAGKIPEFGLVFHIPRDRGGGAIQGMNIAHGRRSYADPRPGVRRGDSNLFGFRYSTYYLQRRMEALSLGSVLQHYPFSLEIVRGIDICTDELGIPHWVIVPLFRYLRQSGELASQYLSLKKGKKIPPLRTSIHAGEEFIHLIGGLRRLDQATKYFALKEGDRIGHGIALGIDPENWAQSTGQILMSKEERLLDLTWVWSWYAQGKFNVSKERNIFIQREISRLSKDIFKQPRTPSPFDLEQFIYALHDEYTLRKCGFPDRINPDMINIKDEIPSFPSFLISYLTDPEIYERGQELEWVDTGSESEILVNLQRGLREKIARIGITIEVNPSSNLLIGNLGDLERHPLWRMKPPSNNSDTPLSIVIGSDDPLTFATNLPNEYQLIRDTLMSIGLSDDLTMHWIDEVRNKGLETRFTLKRTFEGKISEWRVFPRPIPLPP